MMIVLIVVIVLFFIVAMWLATFVVRGGKRQSVTEALEWQSKKYDTSFYNTLSKTDYTVSGYKGYILHVQFLKNPTPTNRYVIISHGYSDNRIGSLKYVQMYMELGFNCIIYDLRGHGENERAITTYGKLESRDLISLIKDTHSRYNDIECLGLHGESLGAATTITSLKYKPLVDFVVADCGFSDIDNVLREGYRRAHLPDVLVDLANMGIKVLYHHSLEEMRPIDALSDNHIPILFLHGKADIYITPDNSKRMAKATRGLSELSMIEGAGHAEGILKEPDIYRRHVSSFLKRCQENKKKN